MNKQINSSISEIWVSRWHSLRYALRGLSTVLHSEVNMRIHLCAAITVVFAGVIRGLDIMQWIVISICIASVWTAELFNTAIEMVCDLYVGKQYNETVKKIKDIAAAGVLVVALMSVAVAVFIFII